MTSQPAMGAFVAALENEGSRHTGIDMAELYELIEYWESVRFSYSTFESGQKSGSAEVYEHEMPGGQYTNLQFQSTSLGLSDQWSQVKKAYGAANRLMGDIVKVTPSSKVVGDLAQFMVTNKLSEKDVREQADTLSFPKSVVEFFQGAIGLPHGGFPQPLASQVVKDLPVFTGRPGESLPPLDLEAAAAELRDKYGEVAETDLMSWVMYPKVYEQYRADVENFGDVSKLPTRAFIEPMEFGEEIAVEFEEGKKVGIKLVALGQENKKDATREVFFEFNGMPRAVLVEDKLLRSQAVVRAKAVPGDAGSIGAPMPGVVVESKVKVGDIVEKGTPMLVLSAMKMETVVAAAITGKISALTVTPGDDVQPGDLLVSIVDTMHPGKSG